MGIIGVLDHRGNAPIGSGPNYGTDSIGTFLYTINSKTGERTLKHQQCFNQQYNVPPFDQITCDFQEGQSYINPEGNLTIKMSTNSNIYEYKENINKFSLYSEWDSDYEDSIKRPISRVDENGNKIHRNGRKQINRAKSK